MQNLPVLDETGSVDPMGAIIMLSFRLIVEWILLQVQLLVVARKDSVAGLNRSARQPL